MKVLGIDPGLRNTGFGVIELINKKPYYLTSGVISTVSSANLGERLKTIAQGITEIIEQFKPDIASVEKVFVNVNPKSTLLLGQARGAAITACVLQDVDIVEYTALQVKKSVVGYGHAEKEQVIKMVQLLLSLNGTPQKDSADALAIAITHINNLKI